MTYKEYQGNHEEEIREADGCEGCIWEYREPFLLERPCLVCKRNATDFFERRKEKSNEHNTEGD